MDLTEAEDIKKRWQEYTEELYKKDLHDPDHHDGVITAAREKPMRRSRHHERRAIFNCMVCRSSVNLLSKLHRTLDSL